jgi:hypothetical protein
MARAKSAGARVADRILIYFTPAFSSFPAATTISAPQSMLFLYFFLAADFSPKS